MGDTSNVSATVADTQKSQAPTTYDAFPSGDMFDTMIKVTISDPEPRYPFPMIQTTLAAPHTETFELYKGVLIFYSDYFRTALDGDSAEARDQHIYLSSADVGFKTFRVFRGWLYTRVVHDNGKDGEDLSFTTIVELWAFADAYSVPMLSNLCLDLFAQRHGKVRPNEEQVWLMNTISSRDSLIRRLFIDLVSSGRRWGPHINKLDWPDEFLHDLVKALWSRPPILEHYQWKRLHSKDVCRYHKHPEGVSCKKSEEEDENQEGEKEGGGEEEED